MANRTFKVYGQAYAASGDVSVTMSVGGTQVFSGAVNDSSTVRSGPPSVENHLWTYELDENTLGELAVSIAVTGGELCLGPTYHNLKPVHYIPLDWFSTSDHTWSNAAEQTYMASQIPQEVLDAQQPGLHAKLVAGTAGVADEPDFFTANASKPGSTETFVLAIDARSNLAINGDTNARQVTAANSGSDADRAWWWPILQNGDTLTYTWTFDPTSDTI